MIRPYDWRPHLQPGEALLWQGRPHPALGLIRPTQAQVLTGLLGAVGAAAVLVIQRSRDEPAGLLVLAMLVALLVAGWPLRAMRLSSRRVTRAAYALTDRRALVADVREPSALRTQPVARAPEVRAEAHGLQTLDFGGLAFAHLKDAAAVQRLWQQVQG